MALNFLNNGYFAGKVGIGIQNPAKELDVSGDAKVLGTLTVETANNNIRLLDSNDNTVNFSVGVNGRFQVRDVAAGTNIFQIEKGAASDSLYIDSSGNVGIGTANPLRKLSVFSTSIVSSEFKGSNAGHLIDISNSNASPTYNGIRFQHNNTFKMGVTHIADGTTRGYIQIGNDYATGNEILVVDGRTSNVGIGTTDPGQNLEISAQGNVAIRLTSTDSTTSTLQFADSDDVNVGMIQYDHGSNYMSFRTNDNERARITSAGNVGIGTTSPGYKLSVDDNTVTTVPKTLLQFDSGNIADNGGYNIDFRVSSNNTADRFVSRIRGIRESTGALSQLSFWTESGSALEQRMTIRASGNVGIGTTSPLKKLSINGGDVAVNNGNSFIVGAAITGNSQIGE